MGAATIAVLEIGGGGGTLEREGGEKRGGDIRQFKTGTEYRTRHACSG